MAIPRTFQRQFPCYHPRKGESTFFVEKMIAWYWDMRNPKYHNVMQMLDELNPDLPAEVIEEFHDSLYPEINEWKSHTIRKGFHIKPGAVISPRVWGNDVNPKSGRSGPYHSKQITFLPELKVRTWNFERLDESHKVLTKVDHCYEVPYNIAHNDGLELDDFLAWFPKPMTGQIICWNENINY